MSKQAVNPARARQSGRPPLPVECARRNRVVTMVTDGEMQLLQNCADTSETTISSLVHDILKQFLSKKTRK